MEKNVNNFARGYRIRYLRQKIGLTQLELAQKLGYKADSAVSKWEKGSNIPNGEKLVNLAQSLNTSTDYILFGDSKSTILVDDSNALNKGDTNTSNNAQDQTDHNATMQNLSTADLKLQRSLLNKLDKQTALLEENNILLTSLLELGGQIFNELRKK